MDEMAKLRKEVAALREELTALKRQPERRQAQVEAVVPVLRRLVVAMGVEERVALRWQEQVIAADDPDARQMANLDLFDQMDSCSESWQSRQDEIGELLAQAIEAQAKSSGSRP